MLNASSGVEVAEHTQVWFGPRDRPVYGQLAVPADGQALGGVVLCPPMGEEGRAAHRTFRRLAESLATRGLMALRFDYDGTGDSAGLQDDPDRVAAWLAGVEAARQYLLDLGAPGVSAVGMRLGATLAACQAASGGGFDGLVLWDPCLSGRTFLREGQALFALGEDGSAAPDDGYRHTPGFQYDDATARSLRGVDLARIDPGAVLAERVLLLSREDRPTAEGILDRLRLQDDRLTRQVALDQDRLLDLPPSDCFVPGRAMANVVAWLVDALGAATPVPVKTPDSDQPVLVPSAGPGSVAVRERARRIGEHRIFALVDEPVDAVAPGRPWVVLVNVAAEHHIGPGRRWVEFARRWAGLGYRCVRLDLSGIGESPTLPGQHEDEPFAPQWLEDMRQVVADLSADGAPVLLVGLCSGAYSSLEAALWASVDGVLAVNPRLTLFPAAKDTLVYTPERRAGIVPARPVAVLARRHRMVAGGLWRVYRQVAVWHAPFLVLRRVVRRGTTLRLLACRDDAQHFTEVLFWRPALWFLRRDPRFRFETDDVYDHSLLTRAGQQATYDRATEFLRERHEPETP